MKIRDPRHTRLVVAARNGDERALDELIVAYLPLLYNIVGRALGGHADVDDVVQETLLRVVRDLPALRDPDSFRSWLVAIAIRQIGSHRDRRRASADQFVAIDEAGEIPDAAAGFEDLTILRMQVSRQRRQVAEASRWLDPEHRIMLSLWWQESTGWLTRGEVAEAMGLTVAHTGVRLQRMREQLEVCRAIAAALQAGPGCVLLDSIVAGWDGERTPVWRKRIARHVRTCPHCAAATAGQIPIERLLPTFAPLTVPIGLIGLIEPMAGQTAATSASLIGKLAHTVTAHPLASFATGAAVVFGSAVTYVTWPESPPPRPPSVIAGPTAPVVAAIPTAGPGSAAPSPSVARLSPTPPPASPNAPEADVPLGAWSLESVAFPGQYLTYTGNFAALGQISASSGEQIRQQATFTVVRGLADAGCVTFRAGDGRYLRHSYLRLQLSPDEGTELFREDATFCPLPGAVPGSVTLQSHNYPYLVIRWRDGGIYIGGSDGTDAFRRQSSFITRNPWLPPR